MTVIFNPFTGTLDLGGAGAGAVMDEVLLRDPVTGDVYKLTIRDGILETQQQP